MSAEVLLCQGRVGRGTACGATELDPRGRLTVLGELPLAEARRPW